MAKNTLVNTQISNYKTYLMYKRQFVSLAENVFIIDGLSSFCDMAFINKVLVENGSIAFFKDNDLAPDGLIALPYSVIGKLDIYGRPQKIEVLGQSGYHRKLNKDQFVIMYDNNGRYPLILDILQYAERISLCTRVIDINLGQMKTPRFWKTKQENEKTVKDLVNNVDGNENVIITYKNLDLDDTTVVLNPAPYIADKVDDEKDKLYNEFLRLIGVANLSYQKKERNITDEIKAMQGGTIASRFSRFEARKQAIDEIKKKFNIDLTVRYYDGIPSSIEELEDSSDDTETEEVDENVMEI